jgi:hypothetical protein
MVGGLLPLITATHVAVAPLAVDPSDLLDAKGPVELHTVVCVE